jgi:hypothetical protein
LLALLAALFEMDLTESVEPYRSGATVASLNEPDGILGTVRAALFEERLMPAVYRLASFEVERCRGLALPT